MGTGKQVKRKTRRQELLQSIMSPRDRKTKKTAAHRNFSIRSKLNRLMA